MNETQQVPNFENEEMRLPDQLAPVSAPAQKSSMFGIVIAFLFVVLIAILGGLYFWYTAMTSIPPIVLPEPVRPTIEENNEPESTTAEAQADSLTVVSTSNELGAIEADVMSTDLTSLDSELVTIESEMSSAASASTTAQ